MKTKWPIVIVWIFMGLVPLVFGSEGLPQFIPAVFWGEQYEGGIILSSPNEMVIIDLKGNRRGKILVSEAVITASISPDGQKVLYATASGLWLITVATIEKTQVHSTACDSLRWRKDGLGFAFASYEKKSPQQGDGYVIKLFSADGDGKDLKQVYP